MTKLPAADQTGWNDFRQLTGDSATILEVTTDLIEILDAVSVPIVVVRRDFTVACFNRAAADALGIVATDIGRSPCALSMLRGSPNLAKCCAEVISTNVPAQHDIRASDRSFIIRIAPYTRGGISGTVLTFTNVTAFRASIDQAIYEREYAKAMLNSVVDPLVVLGAELQPMTANRAFYSLLRLSREELQGAPINALSNGILDLPRLVTQLKETLLGGRTFEPFEIDRDFPGVGCRTMSLQASQFSPPVHSAPMVLLSFHDVTAHRKVEATNSRLAAIVESSSDAIVTNDTNSIIRSWNRGAEQIFGYAAQEVIGKPITLLIPADRQNEEIDILERIKCGERIQSYDTVRQHKNGSLVDISMTISPVSDATGKIIGASKIARDIKDRKYAEEARSLLAHEVDHRSKNLLSLVQAAVHFSEGETPAAIKMAIEGRIQALANVHTLLVESRWAGVDLRSMVIEELYPYCPQGTSRAVVDGPNLTSKAAIGAVDCDVAARIGYQRDQVRRFVGFGRSRSGRVVACRGWKTCHSLD